MIPYLRRSKLFKLSRYLILLGANGSTKLENTCSINSITSKDGLGQQVDRLNDFLLPTSRAVF